MPECWHNSRGVMSVYYMKKIVVLLLIFSSAIVFTAAKNKAIVVHDIPSGVPHDNWFPIGENHGLAVVSYEKDKFKNLDYAKGIYFVKKNDKWYPLFFEIGPYIDSH